MNKKVNDGSMAEKAILFSHMQDLLDAEFDIQLVNLCTSDGFNIHSVSRGNEGVEPDKIAAIASTLCSISNASAEQISKGGFNIATVESMNGDILFLRTQFLDTQSVLCVATSAKMSLGQARFHCQRLASDIKAIESFE